MATTKIQTFGGNVGIGTNDPGAYKLNINGGTSTFEGLEVTNLDVGGTGSSYAPTGLILMWSGTIATIPPGWVLCDGSNNTPDLRAKFILGHDGVTYTSPSSGGSHTKTISTANIPQHNHTVSSGSAAVHTHTASIASAGEHIHNQASWNTVGHNHNNNAGGFIMLYSPTGQWYTLNGNYYRAGGSHQSAYWQNSGSHNHPQATIATKGHSHNVSTVSAGLHGHNAADTNATGNGSAFNVMPEYYVLAYIMKT